MEQKIVMLEVITPVLLEKIENKKIGELNAQGWRVVSIAAEPETEIRGAVLYLLCERK